MSIFLTCWHDFFDGVFVEDSGYSADFKFDKRLFVAYQRSFDSSVLPEEAEGKHYLLVYQCFDESQVIPLLWGFFWRKPSLLSVLRIVSRSWFLQLLEVSVLSFQSLVRELLVCACGRLLLKGYNLRGRWGRRLLLLCILLEVVKLSSPILHSCFKTLPFCFRAVAWQPNNRKKRGCFVPSQELVRGFTTLTLLGLASSSLQGSSLLLWLCLALEQVWDVFVQSCIANNQLANRTCCHHELSETLRRTIR